MGWLLLRGKLFHGDEGKAPGGTFATPSCPFKPHATQECAGVHRAPFQFAPSLLLFLKPAGCSDSVLLAQLLSSYLSPSSSRRCSGSGLEQAIWLPRHGNEGKSSQWLTPMCLLQMQQPGCLWSINICFKARSSAQIVKPGTVGQGSTVYLLTVGLKAVKNGTE